MRYLFSDPLPIGIVTWVSLLVSLIGFAFAAVQILKVKKSSEAAYLAAAAAQSIVRQQQQSSSLIEAISALSSGLIMLNGRNAQASAAYLSFAWNALVFARETTLLSSDREMISDSCVSTRRLRDDCKNLANDTLFGTDFLQQQTSEITRILSSLEEMSARIRLSLAGLQ